MVKSGELKAPVVIGRDHLDSGSVASPNRETESMKDGSDAVSDWPLLNALLNTAGGATWVSLHHGGGASALVLGGCVSYSVTEQEMTNYLQDSVMLEQEVGVQNVMYAQVAVDDLAVKIGRADAESCRHSTSPLPMRP